MSISNVTGNVVAGEDFFDRRVEIDRYWSNLETDSLLLLSPRRVGKTSAMRKMRDEAEVQGYRAVFVDVSDCASELEFVKRLYQGVLESGWSDRIWDALSKSRVGKAVGRVGKAGAGGFNLEWKSIEQSWQEVGDELAEALGGFEGRLLVQVDELPVFVVKLLDREPEGSQRVREFLYWFRRIRLSYPKTRWMLAGSIGLDTIAARMRLSDAINDLRIVHLGAFSTKAATELLDALGNTYGKPLGQECKERVLARVGWLVPYYVQLAFKQLREQESFETAADADRALDSLLRPEHKAYFDYWRQRLELELGAVDAGHALALLNAIAKDPEGMSYSGMAQVLAGRVPDLDSRAKLLRFLVDALQGDGYLAEEAGRYRFGFPLLREYWLRRVAPAEL